MTNPTLEPDLIQARSFLEQIDPEAEAFTFQTFDDSPLKRGHLARITHGDIDEEADRLAVWQTAGAGVFVAINATDGAGRKNENITRVRAAFVDLDGATLEPVQACGLEPHVIVESSRGRWHCYWLTEDLALDQFKPLQQAIADRFAGDSACCDIARVMRLPGFWHQKEAPFQTRIVEVNERLPYKAAELLAEFPPAKHRHSTASGATTDRAMADLVRRILTGEEYHSALRDLAYRWIKAGMRPAQVGATLYGFMDARPEADRDARWQQRRAQIPMLVETARQKFATDAGEPPPSSVVAVDVLIAWLKNPL
jgi:RepB DNA-primase from phage plasmid